MRPSDTPNLIGRELSILPMIRSLEENSGVEGIFARGSSLANECASDGAPHAVQLSLLKSTLFYEPTAADSAGSLDKKALEMTPNRTVERAP